MILLRCARSACLACKCSTCSSPGECHGSLSAKWRVAGCSAGDCSKRCTPCGWLVLTKTAPCRVITAKAMMTWQIMTRGLAQAGDRTSKTARCSQWWDSKPEWSADASGGENQHDWQLYYSNLKVTAASCWIWSWFLSGECHGSLSPEWGMAAAVLGTLLRPACHVDGLS